MIAGAIEHASMDRILAISDYQPRFLYIRRGLNGQQRFQPKDFAIGQLTKMPSVQGNQTLKEKGSLRS